MLQQICSILKIFDSLIRMACWCLVSCMNQMYIGCYSFNCWATCALEWHVVWARVSFFRSILLFMLYCFFCKNLEVCDKDIPIFGWLIINVLLFFVFMIYFHSEYCIMCWVRMYCVMFSILSVCCAEKFVIQWRYNKNKGWFFLHPKFYCNEIFL